MANNLIQIKRSSATAIPGSLSQGELAYTSNGDILYIGSPNGSIVAIGGARAPGVLTANQALVANSTSYIDAIKVANATIQGLYANGATGTLGQVLISGGAGANIYWQDSGALGVNTSAQYTWSNTQTFQNTITFSSVINGTANNANYLGTKSEGNLNVNSATNAGSANNASYLGGTAAASFVQNTDSRTLSGNLNFTGTNTYFSTNIYANAQVVVGATGDLVIANGAGIQANGVWGSAGQALVSDGSGGLYYGNVSNALTANNTTYVNGKTEGNLNVNSATNAGTANNASYLGGNTVGDLNTYASDKAANAYSNAMSDTLSRSGTYTGNNAFSGANTTFSGTNTNVTGFLTTANATLASVKVRTSSLISGSYDRNEVNLSAGDSLQISGGNYGVQLRAANDGTSWFTLNLSGNTGALTPSANGTMDLGNTTNRFGKLWLSGSTIELGNSTISDTANGVTVSGGLQVTSNAIFGNVAVLGSNVDATSALLRVRDATISGNLTINGTLTTVDTSNIKIKDSVIQLADNNTATDTLDIGWYGLSGNASSTWYSGMVRKHDASGAGLTTPVFQLFSSNVEPTGTVDQTAPGFNQGTLFAYLNSSGLYTNSSVTNITANSSVSVALVANSLTLTTALAATYGGTGQNSYSSGDLLVANTGNALSKLSLSSTAGYVLQSNGTALVYASLDAGTF